jgi:hypothetical protein
MNVVVCGRSGHSGEEEGGGAGAEEDIGVCVPSFGIK